MKEPFCSLLLAVPKSIQSEMDAHIDRRSPRRENRQRLAIPTAAPPVVVPRRVIAPVDSDEEEDEVFSTPPDLAVNGRSKLTTRVAAFPPLIL